MSKTEADQIAEHEEEIRKLREKQEELRLKSLPQYPKQIRVPVKDGDINSLKDADGKSYQVVEVQSEEHEKKVLSGKQQGSVPVESADQKLKIDERMAKEEDDKKYYGKETPEEKAEHLDSASTRAGRADATTRKK